MDRVDVLIVTAADVEDDAVRAVTTNALRPWTELAPENDSLGLPFSVWTAEFSTNSGRPLGVALTRALSMGVEATALAVGALSRLAPQCLAMCGVCAGRPGWTELGDVIIADRVYRYDVGETVNPNTRGKPRFHGDLLTIPFRARWKQSAERFRIPEDAAWLAERPVRRALQEAWFLSQLWTNQDPGTASERKHRCPDWAEVTSELRKAGLIKVERAGIATLTSAGRKRASEWAFQNPDGLSEPSPFRVHVGPFATGSNLVRDVDIWARLGAAERLIRGLDMEASAIGFSAFAQELEWFVAKGVMDFAEPARPQRFRKFAARAAAEVLICFLRQNLVPRETEACNVVTSTIGTGEIQFSNSFDANVHPPKSTNPLHPAGTLNDTHPSYVARVCDGELYDLLQRAPLICLEGPTGIGKSSLAVRGKKRLQSTHKTFYLDLDGYRTDDESLLLPEFFRALSFGLEKETRTWAELHSMRSPLALIVDELGKIQGRSISFVSSLCKFALEN